ncbi:MAG: hypothetical protein ABF265_06575, partial [Polaribacter sp.]
PTHAGESDVVYNVHWRVTGISDQVDSDGDPYSSTHIGTQSLNTDDLSNFAAFDTVVHSDVVGWVKAAMGEEQVASIEESIENQINALITPVSVTLTVADDPVVE